MHILQKLADLLVDYRAIHIATYFFHQLCFLTISNEMF
jgi:hypothetical protein